MKTKKILISLGIFLSLFANAQVGINTTQPGSTLTINGSIAADYKIITASTTLGMNDYYTAYNGSSNGTITLPALINGDGNFKGRVYHIKNTGTALLTVDAAGTELIDGASDVETVTVPSGYYIELISKGTTTGSTWELSLLANGSIPAGTSITGVGGAYSLAKGSVPTGAGQQFTVTNSGYTTITNSTYTFTLPTSKALFMNFMVGIDDMSNTGGDPYYRCELFIDGVATGLFQIVQASGGSNSQFTISGVRNLVAGGHTISARIIRWTDNSGGNANFGTLSSVFDAAYLD